MQHYGLLPRRFCTLLNALKAQPVIASVLQPLAPGRVSNTPDPLYTRVGEPATASTAGNDVLHFSLTSLSCKSAVVLLRDVGIMG